MSQSVSLISPKHDLLATCRDLPSIHRWGPKQTAAISRTPPVHHPRMIRILIERNDGSEDVVKNARLRQLLEWMLDLYEISSL